MPAAASPPITTIVICILLIFILTPARAVCGSPQKNAAGADARGRPPQFQPLQVAGRDSVEFPAHDGGAFFLVPEPDEVDGRVVGTFSMSS